MPEIDFLATLTQRYDVDPESLVAVLCPILIPIRSLDKKIEKLEGQSHWRASFSITLTPENRSVLIRGRTGKFVPALYEEGKTGWREIVKGRIVDVDAAAGVAYGEIYVGSKKQALEAALMELSIKDFLEIDQYGAAAKVLSGLAEYSLVKNLENSGYEVTRMPEDMAKHLGHYANFDFLVSKDGVAKKVEVKSIWGTDTRFARLIHSTTSRPKGAEENWTVEQWANYYPTSSCKFTTQDFFAVSLFLRTGNIRDFAFVRSVSDVMHEHGLPQTRNFPEHVNQNPICEVGNGVWFATLDEVWNLD